MEKIVYTSFLGVGALLSFRSISEYYDFTNKYRAADAAEAESFNRIHGERLKDLMIQNLACVLSTMFHAWLVINAIQSTKFIYLLDWIFEDMSWNGIISWSIIISPLVAEVLIRSVKKFDDLFDW